MKRYTLYYIIALVVAITGFASCNSGKAYDSYRSVDINGWDREDTIDFAAGHLPAGTYDISVGFRATEKYPFKELGLNIGWTTYPKNQTLRKTVKCNVFDDNGHMTGNSGISTDDFLYRVGTVTVAGSDSLVITVSHAMNQDDMPGLTAVGVQLTPAIQ